MSPFLECASYDVQVPKLFYSDSVISVLLCTSGFSLFLLSSRIILLILQMTVLILKFMKVEINVIVFYCIHSLLSTGIACYFWLLMLPTCNSSGSVAPKPQTKGIDLDAPGNINGVSVYEFEISSLKDDERPWQKPGE